MEAVTSPPSSTSNATLESYRLLANGVRGAAAVGLMQQILAANNLYVFGEILDHPNIQAAKETEQGQQYLRLLSIFAYGVYNDYLSAKSELPPLDDAMTKKLRLLTLATLASNAKLIPYSDLQAHLHVDSVRELEDLIIEGANQNVVQGKLDQKGGHFEVDFAMARDIQKADVPEVIGVLEQWCDSCDGILRTLESQVARANDAKQANIAHKQKIAKQVSDIRTQLKAQQKMGDPGGDDPDSRMETDRVIERRDKKNAGGGSGSSGGSGGKGAKMGQRGPANKGGFWQK